MTHIAVETVQTARTQVRDGALLPSGVHGLNVKNTARTKQVSTPVARDGAAMSYPALQFRCCPPLESCCR